MRVARWPIMTPEMILANSSPVWPIVLGVAWAAVLVGGGIYARRSVPMGLVAAVLGAPCIAIAIGMFLLAIFLVQGGLLWLGWDTADSAWADLVRNTVAQLLGLWAWIWWVRGARNTSGANWGPGMRSHRERKPRVNVFMKRPW